MKNNKKYSADLFIMGFFMNLIKNFLLLFSAIILLIVGIWVKWCLMVGLAILALNIVVSLMQQIDIYKAATKSDNPDFNEWQDAILSPGWKDNVIELTETKIKEYNDDFDS